MALAVKLTNPLKLKPHPRNVRTHDERNIGSIMASLEAFGQRTPVVVNKRNQVLKGNGTLESIKRLGWDTIEYVVADLSPEQELAYMLADNKTSDLSEFDYAGLTEILKELSDLEVDMDTTGFSEYELKPLFTAQDWSPRERKDEDDPEERLRVQFNEDQTKTIMAAYSAQASEDVQVAEFLTELCRATRARSAVKRKA